jgi:sec-independent protein translocase protein TatC
MNKVATIVNDKPKTFLEHLGELRSRIVISAFAVTAGTIVSFVFSRRLFDLSDGLLTLPLRINSTDITVAVLGFFSRIGVDNPIIELLQLFLRSRASNASTITLFAATPMEKFTVAFKASFIVGVILAAPIVLYQAWAFILPALKQNERRYFLPLFLITLFFFSIGALFSFFIVTPFSIPILAGFLPSIQNQWRIESYFSFVAWLVLAFGVAFELPVVMGFVARIGILNAEFFRKKRKIAVVVVFIISAILTPTQDPFTMSLMAIPLLFLYEVGIRFAVMFGKQSVSELSG